MLEIIAVDWGTSSLRAGLLDAAGAVVEQRRSDRGAAALFGGDFAGPLVERLGDWLSRYPDLPIYASGMVGARGGWAEVPYAACPAGIAELTAGLVRVPFGADREVALLPGIKYVGEGTADVMRGEETQILGLPSRSDPGLVVLPGTHSKWVRVEAGRILSFTTFLTGDLFAALRSATVLKATTATEPQQDTAFDRGLEAGLADARLLSRLFSLRARPLLGLMPESETSSFLSGLLIGCEIREAREIFAPSGPVVLVGEGALAGAYQRGLIQAGIEIEPAPRHAAFIGALAVHRRLTGGGAVAGAQAES